MKLESTTEGKTELKIMKHDVFQTCGLWEGKFSTCFIKSPYPVDAAIFVFFSTIHLFILKTFLSLILNIICRA